MYKQLSEHEEKTIINMITLMSKQNKDKSNNKYIQAMAKGDHLMLNYSNIMLTSFFRIDENMNDNSVFKNVEIKKTLKKSIKENGLFLNDYPGKMMPHYYFTDDEVRGFKEWKIDKTVYPKAIINNQAVKQILGILKSLPNDIKYIRLSLSDKCLTLYHEGYYSDDSFTFTHALGNAVSNIDDDGSFHGLEHEYISSSYGIDMLIQFFETLNFKNDSKSFVHIFFKIGHFNKDNKIGLNTLHAVTTIPDTKNHILTTLAAYLPK